MPALVTHYVLIRKVMRELCASGFCPAHKRAALIGAQGPDMFFFHRVLPWQSGESFSKLGSVMHRTDTSRLISIMHNALCHAPAEDRAVMLGYIQGFLCHYSLDRTAHPYIYWAQERLEEEQPEYGRDVFERIRFLKFNRFFSRKRSMQYHFRIESALDSMMLRRETGRHISEFRLTSTVPDITEKEALIIGKLYVPVFSEIFGKQTTPAHIALAIPDMQAIFRLISDPDMRRRRLLRPLEILLGQGHIITSLLRPADISDWDYANAECAWWENPFDRSIRSHASFFELYEEAAQDAKDMIIRFSAPPPSMEAVENIIGNRGFHTGIDTDPE